MLGAARAARWTVVRAGERRVRLVQGEGRGVST